MGTVANRSTSRARRVVVAGVAGVALPLLLACWSASAAGVVSTDGSPLNPGANALLSRAAGSSPSPTPCPLTLPPTTPTPSPIPGQTPAPCGGLPVLLGGATPSGGAPPTSGGATPALPGGSATPGSQIPGAPGASASASASAAAAAASINPPALLGLLNVLNAPANVGVERPSLHHFRLDASASASGHPVTGTGRVDTSPSRGAGGQLVLICLVAAGLAALLATRRFALAGGRRRFVAAAPLAGAILLGVLMVTARPAAPPATTVSAPVHSTAAGSVGAALVAANVPRQLPSTATVLWQKLSSIEAAVSDTGSRLQALSAGASPNAVDYASLTPPRRGNGTAGPPPATQQQLAAIYETDLQAEYTFFATTVADATQRQALLAAAAVAPTPARDAVAYDLQAVQATLQQEAAIAAVQQSIPAATGPALKTLDAPLAGVITQPFGPSQLSIEPPLTFAGVTYPHFHTGVDIAAPLDSPVVAAADGVVVLAGSSLDSQGHLIGYGNYIVISHAGTMITLYGHLDKLLVHAGQPVHGGDVIGLEGSTGYSTGPHLHFEVRIGGLLTDPLAYLGNQLHSV